MIDAYGVGIVIASGNPEFEKDDYVVGLLSWGEYCVYNGPYLNKLDAMGLPLSYYVGALGKSIFRQSFWYTILLKHVKIIKLNSNIQKLKATKSIKQNVVHLMEKKFIFLTMYNIFSYF